MKVFTVVKGVRSSEAYDASVEKLLEEKLVDYKLIDYKFGVCEFWLAGHFIFEKKAKTRTGGKSGKKIS